MYDNVVHHLWEKDLKRPLKGTNNVLVHTVSLGGSSLSEALYGNSSDVTGGDAIYSSTSEGDEIMRMMFMLRSIRSGFYSVDAGRYRRRRTPHLQLLPDWRNGHRRRRCVHQPPG